MGQHQRCDIAIVFHKLCFFYPLIELFFRMSYLDVVPPYVYFSAPGRLLSFFDDDPLFVFNSCECIGPLSLIHISEPTRLRRISYAVFCLKKKKKNNKIKFKSKTKTKKKKKSKMMKDKYN